MPRLTAALLTCSAPLLARAAFTWVTGSGTDLCMGVGAPGDVGVAFSVGLRKAATCTGSAGPAEYVSITVAGVAATTDKDNYVLADGSPDPAKVKVIKMLGNPVDQLSASETRAGAEFAFASRGDFVDPGPRGGSAPFWYYVGMSAYFVKSGTMSTNVNNFLYNYVDQQSGTMKQGNRDVCIATDGTSGATCGANRTFEAGAFKFSLFGYSDGKDPATADQCKLTLDNGTEAPFFGFRMRVDLSTMGAGITSQNVTFNSGVPLSMLGATPVTSLTVRGATTALSTTFPAKYNIGNTDSDDKKAVANMLIHAWPNKQDTTGASFFLDFVMEMFADARQCAGYMVYDPTIKSVDPAPTTNTTTTTGAKAAVSGSARLRHAQALLLGGLLFALLDVL